MGNDPSLRIETEVYRVLILHLFKALCQVAFFSHTIHGRKVIYFLESLQLSELFSRNCNVVPDDVHIGMSVSFITALLLSLRDLVLLRFLLANVFFGLFGNWSIIILFLCSDHFPFHFESAFAKKLILGLRQIYSYLSSIKDVEVALSSDYLRWLLLCLLCAYVGAILWLSCGRWSGLVCAGYSRTFLRWCNVWCWVIRNHTCFVLFS